VGVGIALFFAFRVLRMGVYLDANSVKVVNSLKTYWVPWARVKSFRLGEVPRAPRICVLELTEGDEIPLWGIRAPNPVFFRWDKQAARMLELLNDECEKRKNAPALGPET
jgi:hypothetical protein